MLDIRTFKEFIVIARERKPDTMQMVLRFPNDYGASVVHGGISYGVELAVVAWDGDSYEIDYSTPVTSDVVPHLDNASLAATLTAIMELPSKKALTR